MEEDVKFYRLHLLHGTCSYPRGVRSYILFCKGLKFTVFRIVGQVVLKDPRGSVAPQGFPLWVGIYRRAECTLARLDQTMEMVALQKRIRSVFYRLR